MNVIDQIDVTERQSVEGIMSFDVQSLVRGNAKQIMGATATGRGDVYKVPPKMLRRMKDYNVRVMTEKLKQHIRTIADSIKENGFYQDMPLSGMVVKEDGVDVIYINGGHNRHSAIELLIEEEHEIEAVPVSIVPQGTGMIDLTVRMVTGNSGLQLSKYEQALCLKRLLGLGVPLDSAWKKLQQRSKAAAESMLYLLESPWELQQMVIDGKVGIDLAMDYNDRLGGEKALVEIKKLFGRAQKEGFKQATRRHAEGAFVRRAIAKSVDSMYGAVRQLRANECYATLPEEVRVALDEIFKTIDAAAQEDAKAKAESGEEGGNSSEKAKDEKAATGEKDQRQLDLVGDAAGEAGANEESAEDVVAKTTNAVAETKEAGELPGILAADGSGTEAVAGEVAVAQDSASSGGQDQEASTTHAVASTAKPGQGQEKSEQTKPVKADVSKKSGGKEGSSVTKGKAVVSMPKKGAAKPVSKVAAKGGKKDAGDGDEAGTGEYRREPAIATA